MNKESYRRQEIVTNFFDLIAQNKVEIAIEMIFAELGGWVPKESIVQVRQQILSLNEYLGAFIGYEWLSDINISEKYVLSNYFCYYERQPLLYEFTFYKPNTSWRVQNLNFKTEFESLISRSSMT